MATGHNQTYDPNHFEMYRNITYVVYQELTCVVGHVYLKKKERKTERTQFICVTSDRTQGRSNWMKTIKKNKLPLINKYPGYNVQHDKYNQNCSRLYVNVIRVNPKISHYKEIFHLCF